MYQKHKKKKIDEIETAAQRQYIRMMMMIWQVQNHSHNFRTEIQDNSGQAYEKQERIPSRIDAKAMVLEISNRPAQAEHKSSQDWNCHAHKWELQPCFFNKKKNSTKKKE